MFLFYGKARVRLEALRCLSVRVAAGGEHLLHVYRQDTGSLELSAFDIKTSIGQV